MKTITKNSTNSKKKQHPQIVRKTRLHRTLRQVCRRYNVKGDLFEWGERFDPPLPSPVVIDGRHHWSILELTRWERPLTRQRKARKALQAAIDAHRAVVAAELASLRLLVFSPSPFVRCCSPNRRAA